jgi:integrase
VGGPGPAIRENPRRIPGYDKEPTSERPTATVAQVFALAGVVPPRYRALILFAAFTGLRWGELVALRRCDLDPLARTVGTTSTGRLGCRPRSASPGPGLRPEPVAPSGTALKMWVIRSGTGVYGPVW